MEQLTINQRLKFLLKTFQLSARTFSELIGESPTNTQNYVGTRAAEPRAGYLQNVLLHFDTVNAQWLLTGQGEPFLSDPTNSAAQKQTNATDSKKFSRSQVVTGNANTNTQNQGGKSSPELALARQEIEHLREQLARADALVAAKEETINLLRASYRNPN